MSLTPSSAPAPRTVRRRLIGMLAVLALLPFVAVATSAPATAATSQFRGVNWAVTGDNFSTGPLVIDGLSSSDSYAGVQAKANAVFDDMQSTLGINTVRLPINTHTVGTAWWSSYRGVIDAATARGWKVVLAYWEDGAASGGRITNTAAFHAMWSTVISQYGSNGLVYFEPMNEPHGYTSAAWRTFAADWLARHASVPDGRVLIGGTGFSQDLRDLCNDSRFASTLFSFHTYTFFYGASTYDGWRSNITTRLGGCASRAVATEFGAPMNGGLNYGDAGSTDNFVRYIRAVTQVMRDTGMGGTYWPALGGKTRDHRLRLVLDVRDVRERREPEPDGPQRVRREPPALGLGRRGRPERRQRFRRAHRAAREHGLGQVCRRGGRLDRERRGDHPVHVRHRGQPAVAADGPGRRVCERGRGALRQVPGRHQRLGR